MSLLHMVGQSVFIINTKNDKKEIPLKADNDVAR